MPGPRVLEHMVDTVIYFEGDRGNQFRILRAIKNRFGPAHEIGVFEMLSEGLVGSHQPVRPVFGIAEEHVPGAAVFTPALKAHGRCWWKYRLWLRPSSLATPRRAVVGWDQNRLSMVLAVLEARCGLSFAGRDVFLNVAGGLRVNEPAADLAWLPP